jgi:hypothetical protein
MEAVVTGCRGLGFGAIDAGRGSNGDDPECYSVVLGRARTKQRHVID